MKNNKIINRIILHRIKYNLLGVLIYVVVFLRNPTRPICVYRGVTGALFEKRYAKLWGIGSKICEVESLFGIQSNITKGLHAVTNNLISATDNSLNNIVYDALRGRISVYNLLNYYIDKKLIAREDVTPKIKDINNIFIAGGHQLKPVGTKHTTFQA